MHGTEQMILNYQRSCIERDKLRDALQALVDDTDTDSKRESIVNAKSLLAELGHVPSSGEDDWHERYHQRKEANAQWQEEAKELEPKMTTNNAKRTPGPCFHKRNEFRQECLYDELSWMATCRDKETAMRMESACNNYERVLAQRDELAKALEAYNAAADKFINKCESGLAHSVATLADLRACRLSARAALAKIKE